jgi:exodeoxyribonuclease V alpha subunit
MLERRPVYTGLTRGKKLVVVIGSRKALWIAIKGKAASRRWSRLNEWLAA